MSTSSVNTRTDEGRSNSSKMKDDDDWDLDDIRIIESSLPKELKDVRDAIDGIFSARECIIGSPNDDQQLPPLGAFKAVAWMMESYGLWQAEKSFLKFAQRQTLNETWTLDDFDGAMEYMEQRYASKWCELLKSQEELRETWNDLYKKFQLANQHLKEALEETELSKKYLHPLSRTLFGRRGYWNSYQTSLFKFYTITWKPLQRQVEHSNTFFVGQRRPSAGVLNLIKHYSFLEINERSKVKYEVHKLKDNMDKKEESASLRHNTVRRSYPCTPLFRFIWGSIRTDFLFFEEYSYGSSSKESFIKFVQHCLSSQSITHIMH